MTVVPFKADAFHGFATVRGLLRHEPSTVEVQFDIADSVTGLARGHTRLAIPKDQIDSIEFQVKFFRRRLRVRVREMEVIEKIPWRVGPEFVVLIRKLDSDVARQFAEDVMWSLD